MTQAIILAAGQGTRLRPITNDRPKCLVPLLGRTLLDRQVDTLNSEGITDIHIATGYRADQIESLGLKCSYNDKYETTNMVESLFSAIEFLRNCKEDLIIAYGDIIYKRENLRTLINHDDDVNIMIDKNWLALWSLRLSNPLDDAETLVLNDNNYIVELGKKPVNYDKIHGQYTGLIKVNANKIGDFISFYEGLNRQGKYDGQSFENMYMTSFIQLLINNGWGVKAAIVNDGWLEIDSVEDLELYQSLVNQQHSLLGWIKV